MKWPLIFLVALALAASCVVEDKPINGNTGGSGGDGGSGGTPDPCGGCEDDTPVCDEENLRCVQCLPGMEQACDAMAPVCDAASMTCVCNTDDDCTDRDLARCDTTDNECKPCTMDAQCAVVDIPTEGQNTCDDGTCYDCTPATEAETCENNVSCNAITNTCTETEIGSLGVCEECVADSECGDGMGASDAFKCILLDYQDDPFPDTDHGFCLKSVTLGDSCTNPYRIVIERPSVSEAPRDEYCAINEDLTTCPAVRALLADTACNPENGEADCPQPAGVCRELPGAVNRCTYPCNGETQCDEPPNPGSTCGPGAADVGDYCGG